MTLSKQQLKSLFTESRPIPLFGTYRASRSFKVGETTYQVSRFFPSGYYAAHWNGDTLKADTWSGLRAFVQRKDEQLKKRYE